MSFYCRCKDCRYMDFTASSGCRYYCEWYGTYEDPDVTRDCPHYDN